MKFTNTQLPIDPVEEELETLAKALYKPPRPFVEGLMGGLRKLKFKVSTEEIEDFCKHWLTLDAKSAGLPYAKDVIQYVRRNLRNNTSTTSCHYNFCDGSGFIYMKKKGEPDDTDNRWYDKMCKCCIGEDHYNDLLYEWEPTKYQIEFSNTMKKKQKQMNISGLKTTATNALKTL